MPGLTSCSASPLNAYDAHRMPVPSLEPLDETDKTAPLCPVGPAPLEITWPCGSNKLLARSNESVLVVVEIQAMPLMMRLTPRRSS